LLVSGDRTASAQLISAIYSPLIGWLHAKRRTRITELVNDAATDALVEYVCDPLKWNPSRASLVSYLCMAADRDLQNAIQKHRRRAMREVPIADVEDGLFDRNVQLEQDESSETTKEVLQLLERHVKLQRDRDLLQLMLSGERSTQSFASILRIETRPASEQRAIVKRHKDRLKKVMQRLKGHQNV
jgi:RNA polymerase sigma-70 factor (ECF subfamily)